MANIKYLPADKIETDGLQIRTKVDPDAAVEYADAMAAGKKFPPLLTFFDGRAYYLADGLRSSGPPADEVSMGMAADQLLVVCRRARGCARPFRRA